MIPRPDADGETVAQGAPGAVVFPCTPGGKIAAGRRRLRLALAGLAALAAVSAAAAWAAGRPWPGFLALAAAALPWLAARLSGAAEARQLEIGGAALVVGTRAGRERVPLAGASARRLGGDEIDHLERLATAGGITAGSGGFESHLLGEVELAASDLANAVLVEAGERRLVVTPDDPTAFVAAVAAAAGG